MLDKHREYEVTDDIEWYFIELPKFRKQEPSMDSKINQWLATIDDENKEMVKMAETKNKTLQKAREKINYLTGDEETRRNHIEGGKSPLDFWQKYDKIEE